MAGGQQANDGYWCIATRFHTHEPAPPYQKLAAERRNSLAQNVTAGKAAQGTRTPFFTGRHRRPSEGKNETQKIRTTRRRYALARRDFELQPTLFIQLRCSRNV